MDRRFLPSDRVFFLKVKGDSMIGRAIESGDFVMVDPATTAKDGDMIAARIGEDATIKTLGHEGANIVLKAANPADRDITVRSHDDFGVLGVVCGVFRPFNVMNSNTAQTPPSGMVS